LDQASIVRIASGFGSKVEVLRASYQSQTFTRHTHDTYTLGMVLSGSGTFWCRGTEHVACKGDLVAIPPGEVHTGSVGSHVGELSYLAIYLPADLAVLHAESAGLAAGTLPGFGKVRFRDTRVRRAFEALNQQIAPNDSSCRGCDHSRPDVGATLDEAAAEEALCVTITELMRGHAEPRKAEPQLERGGGVGRGSRLVKLVRSVLEDRYANPAETSLDVLAEQTGVTPFRVIRAFREATGLSPHHYLIQVRVERARQLLAEGAAPSTTALMTGFVDQSHLTYHFKKHLGITPATYRRCVAGA
jgi:AraC-like DNA-binding protein/mannose-6-phosphate isomerase-like protein (cupin superfamily)